MNRQMVPGTTQNKLFLQSLTTAIDYLLTYSRQTLHAA